MCALLSRPRGIDGAYDRRELQYRVARGEISNVDGRGYIARAWFRDRLRSSQLDLDQAAMRHQEGSWRLSIRRPT